jgi:hypothetical protein
MATISPHRNVRTVRTVRTFCNVGHEERDKLRTARKVRNVVRNVRAIRNVVRSVVRTARNVRNVLRNVVRNARNVHNVCRNVVRNARAARNVVRNVVRRVRQHRQQAAQHIHHQPRRSHLQSGGPIAVGDGCVRPPVEQEERDYPIAGLVKYMNFCVAPSTSMLMHSTIMRVAIATLINPIDKHV